MLLFVDGHGTHWLSLPAGRISFLLLQSSEYMEVFLLSCFLSIVVILGNQLPIPLCADFIEFLSMLTIHYWICNYVDITVPSYGTDNSLTIVTDVNDDKSLIFPLLVSLALISHVTKQTNKPTKKLLEFFILKYSWLPYVWHNYVSLPNVIPLVCSLITL